MKDVFNEVQKEKEKEKKKESGGSEGQPCSRESKSAFEEAEIAINKSETHESRTLDEMLTNKREEEEKDQ